MCAPCENSPQKKLLTLSFKTGIMSPMRVATIRQHLERILFVVLFMLMAAFVYGQQNANPSKYALVIGNGNYTGISKLNNPVNDANDMETALKGLGFTVTKVLNGNLEQMETAVLDLRRRLGSSRRTYGFFFYAGHGVQSNGENYLIPVAADNIRTETQLRERAVSLQFVLDSLSEAENELNMIVLDACRDNPFGWARSGSRGLSVISHAPSGSIVMYATGANSTAADGNGRNGLFTGHLLNNLKTQGLSVFEVFDKTMGDVIDGTNGKQHPELSLRYAGAARAYLGSRPVAAAPVQPTPAPAPAVQPTPTQTASAKPAVTTPAASPQRPVPDNSRGSLIGIAMPETYVRRWVKDGNLLKAEAEKRGYRAEVQWANADQTMQNRQIQNILNQGAKVIIVGSINDGIGSVIAEAARKKVEVISYDRFIPNSADYDYYITINNFKVGVLQAQSIVSALNLSSVSNSSPKHITLFAGSPTDFNAYLFYDGAMSVLNPHIDKGVLRVVGPYPKTSADTTNFKRIATENWQASIAKTRMENLLNNDARDVTLDAILAPNDTVARALIEACKADVKYRNRLPVICGQDAEFHSVMSIKNGEQYSTVFKSTAKLAEAAIILADQILNGQTISIPGVVLAEGDLREIGNTGKKFVKTYLLDPILITKDNISIPVNADFYSADEARRLR